MRHFSLACVAAMILSFTACGGGGVRTEQTTPLDQVVAVANAEGVSAKLFYYKQSQNYPKERQWCANRRYDRDL